MHGAISGKYDQLIESHEQIKMELENTFADLDNT
jgi:hypothetical protein